MLILLPATYLQYPIPAFDYGNCVLAGGAIRDSIQGIKYKDLDIFGPSEDELLNFAERNLEGYKLVYKTINAYTYVKKDHGSVQLVFRRPLRFSQHHPLRTPQHHQLFEDAVAGLLNEFPFTINQFAYNGGENIYTTPAALADTLLRKIRVNSLAKEDIFDTLNRIPRYIDKGYTEVEGTSDKVMEIVESLTAEEVERYSYRPKGTCFGGEYD